MLLTGASGLLGHYIRRHNDSYEIVTLGRGGDSHITCDLEKENPRFTGIFSASYDIVVHAAGTLDPARAIALNLEGTRRLLKALEDITIKKFVYISSTLVYGCDEGSAITEEEPLRPADKTGQSQVLAEEEIRKFCDKKGILLTILRPVEMYGHNMKSRGSRMAAQVLGGTYFNIREQDAAISLVTAYDVARLIPLISKLGGIYNVTDGHSHTMSGLAMAMGNNRGRAKKPFCLPMKWARIAARIGDSIRPAARILNSKELQLRITSLTFSTEKLQNAIPDFLFHDTAEVVARTDTGFPYEDD